MCGLCGWQWKSNSIPSLEKRNIVAVVLGIHNESRGTDSYGWHNTATGEIVKGLGRITPHARLMAPHTSILAHTRHATGSKVTVENAHPFSIGRITGAHNGVVNNHWAINKERKEAKLPEYDVDSMHIFDALSQDMGIDHLEGWGAIEWADKDDPTKIFLCKISQSGSLEIAQTPHGVVWSSQQNHLEDALTAAGIKYKVLKVDELKIHYVQGGIVYATDDKLKIGSTIVRSNYDSGTYGSRMFRADEEDDRPTGAQGRMDFLSRTVGEVNSQVFPGLSKSERKRLIKQRNEASRKSPGKYFSGHAKYKDICECGAWVVDGEPHERWCKKYLRPIIQSDYAVCKECGMSSDKDKKINHHEWCGKLVVVRGVNERPQLKGIFIGTSWSCPNCYAEPQVWDQECPNGHGRVLGNPDAPDPVG